MTYLINRIRERLYYKVEDQLIKPAQRFFEKEVASSVLLLFMTIAALIVANTRLTESFGHFWHIPLSLTIGPISVSKSLLHWINDGLMAFFFFMVGLEIKRELLVGELSSPRKAMMPVFTALGGMIFPAGIYFLFNQGTAYAGGWGIPMATDIAFSLGALAVLGTRLPASIRIFLAAFAIADDIGAVIVIAVFYTSQIVWSNVLICCVLVVLMGFANFLWIRSTLIYSILGIAVWISILGSGIHPTIAGVIVAIFIPAQGKYDTDMFLTRAKSRLNVFECAEQSCGYSILLNEEHLNAVQMLELDCHNVETPLQRIEYTLQPWVAFLILPLFALSNAGITLDEIDISKMFFHHVSLGIFLGLLVGKPLGITLFSFLAVKTKIAILPEGISWSQLFGISLLGGIGFTMSLFVSGLSFVDIQILAYAKFSIFTVSVIAALSGIVFLYFNTNSSPTRTNE